MKVTLGIGCDRGTPLATVERVVERALADIGLGAEAVRGMASIDGKRDEAALLALAAARGWPLAFYSAAQLAAVDVPNPSEVVRRHMGTPSVSEAAALLMAGARMEDLLVEKMKWRGPDGRNATVSVARAAGGEGGP